MSKFCIFCGEKPDQKTKEHIIPQWLIKMTDHEGRKTVFGLKDKGQVSFPWMQYTFPACKVCNENYSELEGHVKTIIENLLAQNELSQNDLIKLLDWFDKVRIGLWLGQSLLNGDKLNPNFHINQRVGISDRLLVIYRSTETEKGILFTGTETLAFKFSPSCFALTINELTFFNYSSAFLLSKNMGFPYPEKVETYPHGQVGIYNMRKGNFEITRPILPSKIIQPAIKIYQTILKANVGNIIENPIPSYVSENSIVCNETVLKSKPFIVNDFTSYFDFMQADKNLRFELASGHPKDLILHSTAIVVFKHQNYEIERALKTFEHLPENEKKEQVDFYNYVLNENNKILEKLEK